MYHTRYREGEAEVVGDRAGRAIEMITVAALAAYLAAVGWLARFIGGSRLVRISTLAAIAVYLRALDARALSLAVVVGSVLLFKDISVLDEKTSRRLVDRSDFLLEGAVLFAAAGVVLAPVISELHGITRGDDFAGLATGLLIGGFMGIVGGLVLFRRRTRSANVSMEEVAL